MIKIGARFSKLAVFIGGRHSFGFEFFNSAGCAFVGVDRAFSARLSKVT